MPQATGQVNGRAGVRTLVVQACPSSHSISPTPRETAFCLQVGREAAGSSDAPPNLCPGTGPELGQEKPVTHYRTSPGTAPPPYTQGRTTAKADRDGFEQESFLKFIFMISFIYLLVFGCPGSSLLCGLSPVAGSWGFSWLRRMGFSL